MKDFLNLLAALDQRKARGSFSPLRRCSLVTNLDSLPPHALHLEKISRAKTNALSARDTSQSKKSDSRSGREPQVALKSHQMTRENIEISGL
jgi:hypothetical protein